MRKIDDVQYAVNQRQAERDQGIHRPGRQAIQERREQDPEIKHQWRRIRP